MGRSDIKKVLDELTADIDTIADTKTANIIKVLINLIEVLADENQKLREENQKLRDEINRLKGEQGKPNIRGNCKSASGDKGQHSKYSSEEERQKQKGKHKNKGKVKKALNIDRHITLTVDKTQLPDDAQFKGYETRVIQDLKISTDNIEFKLEVYYSASLKKTYIAPIPMEYCGSEFGPGIKALIITLYRDSGMTELGIERFLKNFGIQISHGTITSILIEGHEIFHREKEAIVDAGQELGQYQQMDDTGCRVKGKNHYSHVLCNELFTAYFTRDKKDRLTLLELLCRGELKFILDEKAFGWLIELGLSQKWHDRIQSMLSTDALSREGMDEVLKSLFPNPKKHSTNRRVVLEAAALSYYQQSKYFIHHLITDDAPQFNKLALYHALCWVHEGRHYKKLNPIANMNRKTLNIFLERFWDYYAALLAYKDAPSKEKAEALSMQFDVLFASHTEYDALDQRIAKTRSKKAALLLVLEHPFLPLHNNASELGTRVQARIRDIHFQTVSANGTKCKDTFCTIVQTARKLGVNVYKYIYDRVSRKFEMPSLAEMIYLKAEPLPCPT